MCLAFCVFSHNSEGEGFRFHKNFYEIFLGRPAPQGPFLRYIAAMIWMAADQGTELNAVIDTPHSAGIDMKMPQPCLHGGSYIYRICFIRKIDSPFKRWKIKKGITGYPFWSDSFASLLWKSWIQKNHNRKFALSLRVPRQKFLSICIETLESVAMVCWLSIFGRRQTVCLW